MVDFIDRRTLLRFAALGTTNALLAGCPWIRPPTGSDVNILRSTDSTSRLTIDAHCHIFNGSDLPMAPFGTKVLTHGGDFPKGLEGLASLIQDITWAIAPSARKEMEVIAGLRGAGKTESAKFLSDRRQQAHSEGVRELKTKAAARRKMLAAQDALPPPALDAIDSLTGNYSVDASKGSATISDAVPSLSTAAADAQSAAFFLAQLFNYRTCNVLSYLEVLSAPGLPSIDLIVPSMVDFSYWLTGGDDHATATDLDDQISVMEQIAILTGGRVHSFVPFDPLRYIVTRGQSFSRVTKAVTERGCIGVKIYPPMGFAAYGNAGVTPNPWRNVSGLPTVASDLQFGGWLDDAMSALFTWCCANDVPVMAHTNTSNGQADDLEALAGSKYWKNALDRFKNLRVDFGHFGDSSPVKGKVDRRAEGFEQLMHLRADEPGSNAYADSGYFSEIMSDPAGLSARFLELASAQSLLPQRLLYGTDWLMNCGARDIARYRGAFETLMSQLDSAKPGWANAFFGQNAADFYGLRANQPARKRLDTFYARNQVEPPSWTHKVDR